MNELFPNAGGIIKQHLSYLKPK